MGLRDKIRAMLGVEDAPDLSHQVLGILRRLDAIELARGDTARALRVLEESVGSVREKLDAPPPVEPEGEAWVGRVDARLANLESSLVALKHDHEGIILHLDGQGQRLDAVDSWLEGRLKGRAYAADLRRMADLIESAGETREAYDPPADESSPE